MNYFIFVVYCILAKTFFLNNSSFNLHRILAKYFLLCVNIMFKVLCGGLHKVATGGIMLSSDHHRAPRELVLHGNANGARRHRDAPFRCGLTTVDSKWMLLVARSLWAIFVVLCVWCVLIRMVFWSNAVWVIHIYTVHTQMMSWLAQRAAEPFTVRLGVENAAPKFTAHTHTLG